MSLQYIHKPSDTVSVSEQRTELFFSSCPLLILFCSFLQLMRSYFKRADPFFDEQENHSLIGVANVFLSCLFYDVKLQYAVPIINQKGEVGE